MKKFNISYRMVVTIEAETQEEAQEIFDNTNLSDLNPEYVEQMYIEEIKVEEEYGIMKNGTEQGTVWAYSKIEAEQKVFSTYGEYREVYKK